MKHKLRLQRKCQTRLVITSFKTPVKYFFSFFLMLLPATVVFILLGSSTCYIVYVIIIMRIRWSEFGGCLANIWMFSPSPKNWLHILFPLSNRRSRLPFCRLSRLFMSTLSRDCCSDFCYGIVPLTRLFLWVHWCKGRHQSHILWKREERPGFEPLTHCKQANNFQKSSIRGKKLRVKWVA